ncbi:MAG: hypothetical protein E7212_02750 [Clostridium sartagoforme]|nr:hypothetical protein [Clostridium sartagoforme]
MVSNKNIEVYSEITNINEEYFLKDLLSKCYERGLLEDRYLNKIYNDRLELLKIQLKYYTRDNSSSVMVEVAESVLEGIDYTISVYLKSLKSVNLMIEKLKSITLEEMLKRGNKIIKEKFIVNKELLKYIQKNKINVDNYSYKDTIEYGISVFFKVYNIRFTPHETPGSIDYQLCIDDMNYVGVEYIENYLNTLKLEDEFCHKFDIEEIRKLLKGYNKDSNFLLINIFEIVLTNSLGLMICDKTLSSINITNKDREIIKEKLNNLSLEEINDNLIVLGSKLCELLDIKNINLIEYINKAVFKISSLIKNALELNRLEELFISFSEEDENTIKYIDKKKMSNSKFRKITERIRESSLIEEKIELIKNHIKSLEDLIDMLDSECLFNEEFNIYFESLSQFEIVLIFKYISDLSLDNTYDRDWYIKFNNYMSKLTEEEQSIIKEISEKVIFI